MPSIKYMFGKVNKYPEQKLHSQRKIRYPQQKILDLEQTLNVTLETESHLTERNRETINVK